MKTINSFVSIGAGNVATHLCNGLVNKGYILRQVYSRTAKSGQNLAISFNVQSTTHISDIISDADFYLVAVSDHAIPEILSHLKIRDKLIMHTAGSIGLDVFENGYKKFGILYPLQTFSKNRSLDISNIPFLVEGSDPGTASSIIQIARKLSRNVLLADSGLRKCIHVAAVFASNFTNFMYTSAYELLKEKHLDYDLLFPLMEETLRKAQSGNPAKFQTGPAIRGDSNIINEHIKLLSHNPDLQKIYTFISDNIQAYYSKGTSKHLNDE